MRVLTSRKKKFPLSSSRNSKVPALVYCTARAASTTVPPSLRRIFSVTATDGAFLEQLLMAALDRALALAEVDDGAVMIAEHLELDVARPLDVLLDVDVADAERRFGLALRRLERLAQLVWRADHAHAAAAAAGHRLDDHRDSRAPWRSSAPSPRSRPDRRCREESARPPSSSRGARAPCRRAAG